MKRRLLLFLVAMGLVIILWAIFGDQGHRFTLADGTTVTFHGVSVGTSNRYCFGNPAKRIAAKLPLPWAQKFAGNSVLTVPVDGETNLVLWVTYRGAAPRGGQLFRFRCVHDGGTNELEFNGITKYGLPSGEAGTAFYTAYWPRRSKRLALQALADDAPPGAKPLWEVRVPNLLPLDYPQWQPEALPACRNVEKVTVCLEQLVPSNIRPGIDWQRSNAQAIAARLRVTRDGQRDNDWKIQGVRFHDQLGKWFQEFRFELSGKGGIHDVDFALALLGGERAGKLGITFARVQGFQTNDLFELPELKLPAVGKSLNERVRTSNAFGEISIHVSAHNVGRDGFFVSAYNWDFRGDVAESNARWLLPVAATDNLGRSYSFGASDPGDIIGSPSSPTLRVPSDAKSLRLTVASSQLMFVEYTVGPESVRRPK